MHVSIKGDVTKVKLTKAEQRTLRNAHGLCASLAKIDGGPADEVDGPLAEIIGLYCDDETEPEPAEAGRGK